MDQEETWTLQQGSFPICVMQPFKTCFFSTNTKRNHHLQGNVQVYNVRIPIQAFLGASVALISHGVCPGSEDLGVTQAIALAVSCMLGTLFGVSGARLGPGYGEL